VAGIDNDVRARSLDGLGEIGGERGIEYFKFGGTMWETERDLDETEFWPFNIDRSRLGGGGGFPLLIGDLGNVGDLVGAI
jgi:hypothetical protein